MIVVNRSIDFTILPRDVLLYMCEWLEDKDRSVVASICKITREDMKGCYFELDGKRITEGLEINMYDHI